MGIKAKRKIVEMGGGTAMVSIPAALERAEKGSHATLAANRLLLMDPRGLISEDALLNFLESEIEPVFWPWFKRLQKADSEGDGPD